MGRAKASEGKAGKSGIRMGGEEMGEQRRLDRDDEVEKANIG
jgi:hypothetical protein